MSSSFVAAHLWNWSCKTSSMKKMKATWTWGACWRPNLNYCESPLLTITAFRWGSSMLTLLRIENTDSYSNIDNGRLYDSTRSKQPFPRKRYQMTDKLYYISLHCSKKHLRHILYLWSKIMTEAISFDLIFKS